MQGNAIERPVINHINVVMDCADADEMAVFYSTLLGWEYTHQSANGWAAITAPDGTVYAFQQLEGYQPPVWPWEDGKQAQMIHLDFWVDDLQQGVDYALQCGATLAGEQYYKSSRTLLDPAGHPFCIDTDGEE
ncbi:VOC family protein [Eubacteriales bacterium OttesenSCG-928-N14]|nr:VOC family protein [Eubacteriales bacterium OttesenSCG-928-N14]